MSLRTRVLAWHPSSPDERCPWTPFQCWLSVSPCSQRHCSTLLQEPSCLPVPGMHTMHDLLLEQALCPVDTSFFWSWVCPVSQGNDWFNPGTYQATSFCSNNMFIHALKKWQIDCVETGYVCEVLRCVQLFVTLWTVAHHVPLFMGFSRQEYWSGLPCPLQRIFLTQGWNASLLSLLHWQVGSLSLAPFGKPCCCCC